MTGSDVAPPDAVVVGVGAEDVGDALSFAVEETRRAHRPLHLLHVLQLPAGEPYVGTVPDLTGIGRQALARAAHEVRELAGFDLPLTAELVLTGWVVDELVRLAPPDSRLVLQHRRLGRARRLVTGSVVQSVAGRARATVISVPESWSTRADRGVVTVAVQDPAEAPGLLELGLAEAAARGCGLTVLHAWWLGSGLDRVVVDESYCARRAADDREELQAVLDPLRAQHPDVPVRVQVRHLRPADAVVEAGGHSDLLVLGRRHHRLAPGSHVGPATRAALSHSACPVLISPEPDAATRAPAGPAEENQT